MFFGMRHIQAVLCVSPEIAEQLNATVSLCWHGGHDLGLTLSGGRQGVLQLID
jgi:hypothetical protein